MNKRMQKLIALFSLFLLLASMIVVPNEVEAASEFYGDYTDVAKIYDYGSCPSIQGLAVGSQKLYTIKINGSDNKAFISMTDKDSGETVKLYNTDNGSYFFTNLNHANDMDVWGIDGKSHIFVATTLQGANAIVRLKRDGENLTQVGTYHLQCNGSDICATAMGIMSVSNGQINFITKWGMDLYTGSVSTSATNATINMTKLCSISKDKVYIKGEYLDLSNFVNQGMGYHNGVLYVPISGDDTQLNRSVIMVFNLDGVIKGSTIRPSEAIVFRVTSGAYSALFELESCDICSGDNRLYFGVQRRVTTSDTNHDGIGYFKDYTFVKLTDPAKYKSFTIQYEASGGVGANGSGAMADTVVPYGVSTPLSLNSYIKNGCRFAGWTAYRTTQKQWYYTNGTTSAWYAEGSQPDGYTKYIYGDGNKVAKTSSVDGDRVILYAQWEPSTFTVRYDPNGGTGTMEDSVITYGVGDKLRANTFVRPGYDFIGWTAYRSTQNKWLYIDPSSGASGWYQEGSQPEGYVKDLYYDQTFVAKTTGLDGEVVMMYAQWEANEYTVTFKDEDGTVLKSGLVTAGTVPTPPADPTKGGDVNWHYTFAGWDKELTAVTGDAVYTATYEADTHNYAYVVKTDPTCTEQGYTTFTCNLCGYSHVGSYTEPLGHNYQATITTAPGCETAGVKTFTCENCGDAYTESLAATGHSYKTVTVDATCTEDGSITDTCANCGDTKVEVIPATGHSHEAVITAPTCTEVGYTTYTCACGDTYTADEVAALGHKYQAVITTVPGCDSAGVKTFTCENCGDVYTEPLAATGHNYVPTVTDPTCTEKGYTTYECPCGHSYTADEVAALGHSYETVTVEATCTEDGSITDTCATCGDTKVEVIPATGHSHEAVVTAPTCTEAGYTTYTCACGDTYTSDEVAALGHSYETVTVEATCTEDGSITDTCATCGDTKVEVIPAKGHSHEAVVTAPTCTEVGYTTYTCACGDTYTADEVAALGHSYETVTVEATCTEDGSITDTCATCGDTKVEVIPAKGHSHEAVVTAPTCTEAGYTTYTCACGDTYTADEVAALGHSYETVTVEATCTEDGSITDTCATCGDTKVEVIPATGHSHEAVVTAPTCTEAGYTTYTCACGDTYTADEVAALGHSYETVTVEATCTEDGSITDTCTTCGDTKVEVIPATGHSHEAVITAPTCTEVGYTTYTCACGDTYTADEVAALGHSYETVTVEATCTEDGSITDTCATCGDTKVEVIPAKGHSHEAVITAPTCTEVGYTTYTCACGDTYTADEVAALGHSYETVTVDATCTEDGSITNTCAACGDTKVEVIPAKGHSHEAVVTAPTCTEVGYTTYTCACGDTYTADEVAALGHSYETVTVEATCTKDGSITDTCATCGDTKVEVIPATGHSHEAVITAPTCTEAGYTTYTCACGDTYTADEVAALGHSYETVTVEATCTEDGSITDTCTTCGDTKVEVIPATGHSHEAVITAPTCTEVGYTTYTCACGDTYTADEVAALGHSYETVTVEATCTEDGSITDTCATCGDTKVEVIPAKGHSYVDGTCTACGAADPDYVAPIVKPTLKLRAPTLEFKDMITVNAFFTAENIQDVVEMGMITYSYKADLVSVETAEHRIPGAAYIESSGRYLATSQGIHAKYLGDTVYLAVYAELKDGSYVYTILAPYSPVDYATNQIKNSTNVQLKQLCAAMLNYGAEAQLFFGHNTSALANASLTDEQKQLPEAYREDMVSAVPAASKEKQGEFANNQGFAKRTPSISFEGAFCINYFFTPNYAPVDGITMYYWNEADYNAVDVLTTENASGSFKMDGTGASQYNGSIEGIAAKALSEAVYVAATYSDGTTTWTSGVLGYSIGSYCSSQASKGAAVSNLAMATAVYGYQAKQYFG